MVTKKYLLCKLDGENGFLSDIMSDLQLRRVNSITGEIEIAYHIAHNAGKELRPADLENSLIAVISDSVYMQLVIGRPVQHVVDSILMWLSGLNYTGFSAHNLGHGDDKESLMVLHFLGTAIINAWEHGHE